MSFELLSFSFEIINSIFNNIYIRLYKLVCIEIKILLKSSEHAQSFRKSSNWKLSHDFKHFFRLSANAKFNLQSTTFFTTLFSLPRRQKAWKFNFTWLARSNEDIWFLKGENCRPPHSSFFFYRKQFGSALSCSNKLPFNRGIAKSGRELRKIIWWRSIINVSSCFEDLASQFFLKSEIPNNWRHLNKFSITRKRQRCRRSDTLECVCLLIIFFLMLEESS